MWHTVTLLLEYDPRRSIDIDADGGRTATGQTIPILGERRLQMSLVETLDDLMMKFKGIDGLTKPLGSVAKLSEIDAVWYLMENPPAGVTCTIGAGTNITRSFRTMESI